MATAPETLPDPVKVQLGQLRFDADNPRFLDQAPRTQRQLLKLIESTYDPIEIGRSIAKRGYFPSEPLIVIREGSGYTVIEGNRRLAALKLLKLPKQSTGDEASQWRMLSREAHVPDSVPVVVAGSREQVDHLIGYRHISGIEPWKPYAKARFVARLVERARGDFASVADDIGERESDVRAIYRNYAIARQAHRDFKVDIEPLRKTFGVFTRAMNSEEIRAFIGAGAPADVKWTQRPIPKAKRPRLAELLVWMFGKGANRTGQVLTDSRLLGQLAEVLHSPSAVKVLRETSRLESAYEAAGGIRARIVAQLVDARKKVDAARRDYERYKDDADVQAAANAVRRALDRLTNA